ncbi:MAG: DUF2243 domain-containing protein, partial [Starkeya sp.]|nr:DUF2243 domain-containing protein [Starkeya sp.]
MGSSPLPRWGAVLGFALGGFFDGILLHQILQWHHLLSLVPGMDDLRLQVLWDGYFHALMYGLAALALVGLWRAHRRGARAAVTTLAAALLIGILIAVIGASLGPLTGFAMNPARDFGPKLFAFVAGWGDVALTGGRDNPYFWVPILGPIVGAQIGTALYVKVLAPCVPGNRVATEEAAKLSNKEE